MPLDQTYNYNLLSESILLILDMLFRIQYHIIDLHKESLQNKCKKLHNCSYVWVWCIFSCLMKCTEPYIYVGYLSLHCIRCVVSMCLPRPAGKTAYQEKHQEFRRQYESRCNYFVIKSGHKYCQSCLVNISTSQDLYTCTLLYNSDIVQDSTLYYELEAG